MAMATVYVAVSKGLQGWGSDIGISKHIYKVGVTDQPVADVLKSMIDDMQFGQNDWKIIAKRDVAEIDGEEEVLGRLAIRLKLVDPTYYPKLKGARCVFKVNPLDVDTHIIMKQTMAGEQPKVIKQKPADIGNYLIENALR
jgi:hypothetical protein